MPKRPPFLYGRRTCIFCTRHPPEVKISKEHIFADWLRAMFPRTAATTHTYGVITWPTPSSGLKKPTVSRTRKQGHSGSRKVRSVCQSCNGGWLGTSIEDIAKPILISLMHAEHILINEKMQRILATWAAKTVMTAEQIDPAKAVVHQDERTWLMEKCMPPAGWHVWICSYSGNQWRDLAIFQHPGRLEIPAVDNNAPTEHNLELTMIGLGNLLFLVINSSWSRIWDILDSLGSPGGTGMARIWPITTQEVVWPRLTVFDDRGAEYFTTYLARVLEQPV